MKFDPEKSLFDLHVVRIIATGTTAGALIVACIIVYTSDLQYQPGYSGLNNLINIFKIPIGILALGLSLIGLCGANHRSEQTRRQIERTAKQIDISTQQIESTKSQNNFSNYYKHVEEFAKSCSKVKGLNSVNSPKKLHNKLFPHAQIGNFLVCSEAIVEFEKYGNDLREALLKMANDNDFSELWSLRKINFFYSKQIWVTSVEVDTKGSIIMLGKNRLRVPSNGPQGYIEMHMDYIRAIDEIFSFDISYQSPRIITILSSMGLGFVPETIDEASSINFPDLMEKNL